MRKQTPGYRRGFNSLSAWLADYCLFHSIAAHPLANGLATPSFGAHLISFIRGRARLGSVLNQYFEHDGAGALAAIRMKEKKLRGSAVTRELAETLR